MIDLGSASPWARAWCSQVGLRGPESHQDRSRGGQLRSIRLDMRKAVLVALGRLAGGLLAYLARAP